MSSTGAMSADLRAVTRTTDQRRKANAAWRDALAHARENGHTLQAIADAAGVTRQTIFRTLANIERSHHRA